MFPKLFSIKCVQGTNNKRGVFMFKDVLKRKRKDLRMSQIELAERVGVSNRSISEWEKGSREPTLFLLEALADFFECSLDELADRK
jgi:transcriptional regulator with XRE-family HTH domain